LALFASADEEEEEDGADADSRTTTTRRRGDRHGPPMAARADDNIRSALFLVCVLIVAQHLAWCAVWWMRRPNDAGDAALSRARACQLSLRGRARTRSVEHTHASAQPEDIFDIIDCPAIQAPQQSRPCACDLRFEA
jgi:hypothetical protein